RVAEEMLMVERHRRDRRNERRGEHVAGVEAAAESGLDQRDVGGLAREREKRRRRGDLEIGDVLAVIDALAFLEKRDQPLVVDQRATDADTLVEADEMRLRKHVDALAGGFEERAHERDRRAFAVGARDMDDVRHLVLRIAKLAQEALHPVEGQVDQFRVQAEKPRQNRIDLGFGFRAHAALAPRRRNRPMIRASWSRRSLRCTTRSTMPCSRRYSARWKPSGSFSRIVSSMTRAPAKPITAPGSAMVMSPSIANEAETPPVVGSVSTTIYGRRAAFTVSTAMVVRGSCISDRTPSCMRAPPDAGTTTRAASCSTASRAAARSPSPTATPIEPPMKLKSKAATTAATPPIVPCATTSASRAAPFFACASLRRSV